MSKFIDKLEAPITKSKFTHLALPEIIIYFAIWIVCILLTFYEIFKTGNDFFNNFFLDLYNDFKPGWAIIGRKKDQADAEWRSAITNLTHIIPNLFIHLAVSEFLKKVNRAELLPAWHLFMGSFFVASYLGVSTLALFFFQPIFYYILIQYNTKFFIWFFSILLVISSQYFYDTIPTNVENYFTFECKNHMTIVTLGWINLRCVNYAIDALDDKDLRKIDIKNLVHFTSYCLYLPLLYLGPIVLYSDFKSVKWWENDCVRVSFSDRFTKLLFNLLRFGFWYIFLEFAFHYFYVYAIVFNVELVNSLNSYPLFGIGYMLGQFFHVKYVIFYGLTTCLTHFELEIAVPRSPKCISRIHLFSDMWRYFDRGLYLFIIKYIFKPTANVAGKLIGSLIAFTYIFIWHGLQSYLLIWTTLNYVGICIETLGMELAKREDFNNLIKNIDGRMYRRLQCMVASPLYAMSCISYFYFATGQEVGDIFVARLFSGPQVLLNILLLLYCGSQCSMEIKYLEKEFAFNCSKIQSKTKENQNKLSDSSKHKIDQSQKRKLEPHDRSEDQKQKSPSRIPKRLSNSILGRGEEITKDKKIQKQHFIEESEELLEPESSPTRFKFFKHESKNRDDNLERNKIKLTEDKTELERDKLKLAQQKIEGREVDGQFEEKQDATSESVSNRIFESGDNQEVSTFKDKPAIKARKRKTWNIDRKLNKDL